MIRLKDKGTMGSEGTVDSSSCGVTENQGWTGKEENSERG